jgi:alpha-D-xyloside xylohydrolase
LCFNLVHTWKEGWFMYGFRQHGNALLWSGNDEHVRIEAWGQDSLRVRATVSGAIRDSLVNVLLPPKETHVDITIDEREATIRNGTILARVSSTGLIRFFDAQRGVELLAEVPPGHATRVPPRLFKATHGALFHVEARFHAYDDERFYGLGQHQHGLLDQKGCTIDLIQRNTEITIPFLVSSRGYGFLWHNPSVGRVELGQNGTRWVADATPQLDYWITAGNTPATIMEHYADATGYPSEFPEWASGFWQCKLRYRSQDEVLAVVREHKRRGLPLSVIVIDFFHWTLQGDWRFDPELWPDPTAMARELNEMGVRVMVSIWPTVNPLSENFGTLRQRGLLVRTERGNGTVMQFIDNRPEGLVSLYYYDATNPEARDFIWEQVHEHYYQQGIKTFWLDVCEPEMSPMEPDNVRFFLGNGAEVGNSYPLLHERGFYEHMQAAGETQILNLCRSAWAGSQRYGVLAWSGDISSTFEALRVQVRAGLNMAMSGIPWWTTDIGGFYGADSASSTFRELIVRWFQYSTFCPVLRLHGYRNPESNSAMMIQTGGPNEVWSFGAEAYAIISELLALRERLRPYVMEQMQLAHERGIPPMRPLFFDFPNDETASKVDDQYLFGPNLLVAPVLYEGARSRKVYLPAGTTWTDAWTGEVFQGGCSFMAEAPLSRIPLYLKASAQLPIVLK